VLWLQTLALLAMFPRNVQAEGDQGQQHDEYDKLKFDEEELDEQDEFGVQPGEYVEDDEEQPGKFHMDDFSPSHVFTFPLTQRENCFFEEITKSPIRMRGAYFVTSDSGMDVNVYVSKVNNIDNHAEKTLFEESGKTEGVFSIVAQNNGEYKVCFVNPSYRSSKTKRVTFAVHVGIRKKEHAKAEHITPLEGYVQEAHHALNDLVAEQAFIIKRTSRHMATQDSTEWRVAWYTVFESCIMLAVTLGQVFYVQRLINNRQWV